ncbi:LPP20 family lipoprotein [Thiomicrorhabdus xiamenensis]|uniref:LPP20 family lipoprotein n=1 Tax=Thiomicrorhabdus xiamenensis TaxID=2739063 RepID=A0A7D4P5D7_9GAMM|nr:LPP20 family lipoprotein [Thiomicrorhabdus xiamenensis]QKI89595.1 LPP20 family lipoprotein [Thiomicrorhabdus xiamenensis]
MKKSHLLASAVALSIAAMSGCSATPNYTQGNDCCDQQGTQQSEPAPVHQKIYQQIVQNDESEKAAVKKDKSELIKITGIGYGAESTFAAYTTGQRRLMAIRASKLDAYRSLAEQLSGIKIDSNTSISTLTAKNDSFRARINAVVRGARVVSVTPMADNNYETVLEVYVDKAFFEKAFVYTGDEVSAREPEAAYRIQSYQ